MSEEDRILEEIKVILKELDEQGRMKHTQKYMQHIVSVLLIRVWNWQNVFPGKLIVKS